MNDLVHHAGGQVPDRPRQGATPLASALSVDSVSWNGGSHPEFTDMGVSPPQLSGRELHRAVIDEGLVRRRRGPSGDRYHRRRVGWVATTTGIVVVRAEQALRPDAQGRMRPHGDFVPGPLERLDVVGEPQRRMGDIADVSGAPRGTTSPAVSEGPSTSRPKGYWRDSPFAPTAVRQGLAKLMPEPDTQLAQAVSYNKGARFSVSLLVIDRGRAAAVECSRLKGATHWQVEQLTFDLRHDATAVGAPTQRGRIGG